MATETYPSVPGWKGTDTSQAAAQAIPAPWLRWRLVESLTRVGPQTADELAQRLGIDRLSIRPRCSELRRTGEVVDSGIRRRNQSGKSAIVWALKQEDRHV